LAGIVDAVIRVALDGAGPSVEQARAMVAEEIWADAPDAAGVEVEGGTEPLVQLRAPR
jgi:hypothetical protein